MNIDKYSFGSVVVDGKTYKNDILIVAQKIKEWWRERGHLLQNVDLKEVWSEKPDVLIVGKGASGVMDVAPEVKNNCAKLGIELISAQSPRAVKKFNKLSQKRDVAFGIHLTC